MKNSAKSAAKSDLAGFELAPSERILCVFRPDLNAELRFSDGLLVVTSQRVWFQDERGTQGELLRDLPIEVERREHAGVCELFLRRADRLVRFRYTLARAALPSWPRLWADRRTRRARQSRPTRTKTRRQRWVRAARSCACSASRVRGWA